MEQQNPISIVSNPIIIKLWPVISSLEWVLHQVVRVLNLIHEGIYLKKVLTLVPEKYLAYICITVVK